MLEYRSFISMQTVKKKSHLPVLVIIPHGGYRVPEEFQGYEAVDRLGLFLQSDTCANELFTFGDRVAGTMDTAISRLFVDLDRPLTALPPDQDGIIKKSTLTGKPVFAGSHFPDEIAIANVLRRYWSPFHDAASKIIDTGGIRLILECHTIMAVGPKFSRDPEKPRPIARLEHVIPSDDGAVNTCDPALARGLLESLKKSLAGEEDTIAEKLEVSRGPSRGYILARYGTSHIPMIRLSLSKSLYLNETYFNIDFMKVDELRLRYLRDLVWNAVERFFCRNF